MGIKNIFIILCISFLTISCSKEEIKKSVIKEKDLDKQVFEAYIEGKNALRDGDILFAAKKFNDAEKIFPQSDWAPRSALMAAYSYYSQDYYGDSIAELERFIKIYPLNQNLNYAYYLLGICYYEQIVDETKDTQSILKAKEIFQLILNKYPNSDYALDATYKLDLINEILAAKEMYIARYYQDKKKWIPAINRFKVVLDNYDTTIYTEEALHRLVEIYYILGLENEAKKYAKLLGYNFQSSTWYEKTYIIFNTDYEKKRGNKINKDKKNLYSKIKSLFD